MLCVNDGGAVPEPPDFSIATMGADGKATEISSDFWGYADP